MMPKSLALLVLLLGSCACFQRAGAPVAPQYAATVSIAVHCGDGTAMGSGVVVSERQVLTALHVVSGKGCDPFASVALPGGEPVLMIAEVGSPTADVVRLVALTGAPFADVRPPTLGAAPRVGDEVCLSVAIPRRGRKCGEVQPIDGVGPPGNMVHNAITEPGNSGGPVYDTAGHLVAIITHMIQAGNGQIVGGRATTLAERSWLMPVQ